jgi:hypothetical protein
LRHEQAHHSSYLSLHDVIIKKRGSRRPDSVDAAARDCFAAVIGRFVHEVMQSMARNQMQACIG